MNSDTFFRVPSEWVKHVISSLEQSLSISIQNAYRRSPVELSETTISYQVGESEPVNHTGNDGRKLHDIELRFLVEVPTSTDFDLEALDASTRLERELLNQRFGCFDDTEESRLVSNVPRKFDPTLGVFMRVVTLKQRIYMGPVDHFDLEFCGSDLNAAFGESPAVTGT
ncbi:hypothetical protein [Photobacterium sp. TLY01]|uniref:hypothetical protein n=1 Tax=Photobacterium sp. TLY01 TaxID=2907534 RepID=UPI001F3BEE23|nr:hypothetical protein [Photobacterium sp. TLY01]UIP28888.1 hypothetical protein LN341_05250 [Photobacterium sp. TLY01]